MKKIIWIDEEIKTPILRPYVFGFEENGFEVIKVNSVNDIKKVLEMENGQISVIIVGMVMSPGNLDADECVFGLRTGIVVLKKLKDDKSLQGVPLICASNSNDKDITDFCRENGISYICKRKYFSDTFVDEVDRIIDGITQNKT